jgi:hypothetical protein
MFQLMIAHIGLFVVYKITQGNEWATSPESPERL